MKENTQIKKNLMSAQQTHQRDKFIDFARGLAMILVLWHHASLPGSAYILGFHMPLFFFLSGYLYRISGSLDKNGGVT